MVKNNKVDNYSQEDNSNYAPGLDSRLLNANFSDSSEDEDISSADKAGELAAAKREQGGENNSNPDEPQSLREAVIKRKKDAAKAAVKEGVEGKLGGALSNPARKGTSALLSSAWINLIPSFGLTLIWINIHAFLNLVLGDRLFCKLGEEWADKVPGGAAKAVVDKKASATIGLVEKFGLGCLDLGCLLVLFFIGALIAVLLNVVQNPLDSLAGIVGFVWDGVKNFVVGLFD